MRSLTPVEAGQEAAALVARAMSEVVETEAEVRTDASHPEHASSWASATWAAAGEPPFVPGLYFATRVVTLREDVVPARSKCVDTRTGVECALRKIHARRPFSSTRVVSAIFSRRVPPKVPLSHAPNA